MDPLADQFSSFNPYHYVYNNPIIYTDPTGAAPSDWYEDQDGNVVYDQNITSQADLDAAGISGTYLGEQGSGIDANSGEMVVYNCDGTTSCSSVSLPEITITGNTSNSKDKISTTTDGIGGLGVGVENKGGSVRLTNGTANGNALSLKHYDSGWNGGSRAQIKTYQLGPAGKTVGRLGTAGTVIVGGVDIASNAYQEGGFGKYTQQATGRTAGSLVGSAAGAKAGAAVGAWIGGWGAIPGAIIGGVIGGYGGSKAGESAVKQIQKTP